MIRRRSRRTLALLLTTCFAAACGGDAPTQITPPPPPPPPLPTAASVAVVAGSGQIAPAGEATAVAPAVVVRDSDGNPFAGATVVFSVTEGGGTLEGASQVTDAAGTARVTRWTLGQTGAQRLTVTVGSLTPVSIDATIDPTTESITALVPTTGGTITISTPGHPYEGLTLTVPSGSYEGDVSWNLQVSANVTPPALPTGYRVLGPALDLSTDGGRSDSLLTLELPARAQPGEAVVVVFMDPARGVMEVLPTVGRTDSTVRVVTTHLSADLLLGPSVAAPLQAGGSAFSTPAAPGFVIGGRLLRIALDALPQPPVPSVFNTLAGRWPVLDNGSAAFPQGFGVTIPAMQLVAAFQNRDLSKVKALSTPGFYADAGLVAALNRTTSATSNVTQLLQRLVSAFGGISKRERDELVAIDLTATMAVSGKPALAAFFASGTGPTREQTVFGNTVGSLNNVLSAVLATSPSSTPLPNVREGLFSLGLPFTADRLRLVESNSLLNLGQSSLFDTNPFSLLGDLLKALEGASSPAARDLLNDSLAAGAGLEKPVLEAEAVPGGGYVPLADSGPVPVRGETLNIRVRGGIGGLAAHLYESGLLQAAAQGGSLDLEPFVNALKGSLQSLTLASSALRDGVLRQLYAQRVELVRARFEASPDTARITSDSATATFEAEVPHPPAQGFRVRWEWGDGDITDNLGLTNASHTYSVIKDYIVPVTMLSADGEQVLAVDTVHVRGIPASPHWRIKTIFNQDDLGVASIVPITVLLRDAIANPASAMIAVDSVPGGTELRLRVLASGTWTVENCCGAAGGAPASSEARELLGVLPRTTASVGSYFAGFGASEWTQSSMDLSTGSMSAQASLGSFTYNVRNGGSQVGPRIVTGLTATRNGRMMTGTIIVVYWPVDDNAPGYVNEPEYHRFPFTAERIK